MTDHEVFRQSVEAFQERCSLVIPADRATAITAVVHAIDRQASEADTLARANPVFGQPCVVPGGNRALHLCLSAAATTAAPAVAWAEQLLDVCGRIAEAEQVLVHCETGFMRVARTGAGEFDAWVATPRPSAVWLERLDFDWWGGWLARRRQEEMRVLQQATGQRVDDAGHHRQIARLYVATMAHQTGYPPDATIGGCSIQTYCDVLVELIALALGEQQRGETPAPQAGRALAAAIAPAVPFGPGTVERALAAFTLDVDNAAHHARVAGIAAAPLVRVDAERVIWSFHGLTTQPLLFLMRELRRRFSQEYHDSAHLREGVFRADLYSLFQDKRYVTSANRIELRRASGDIRTDVDAVVFDRKTGTLAFFELKSQDPFARSGAELIRQRDNLLYANRQVSGVLAWLNRSGAADDLLNRVDQQTAKRFRVQKVYPFVLGRSVAHFPDGPEPDRRAAWGTWPQLLRLLDGQSAAVANPLASLHGRLAKDGPARVIGDDHPSHAIAVGDARLTVHPSWTAFRQRASR